MWHWDKEVNDGFTGDFGRHRTWRSAHFGLRHRYPQGRGGHGASLQPGGAGAVREAGVDKSGAHRCNSLLLKAVCVPSYIGYVLVCVYGINGTLGFAAGFWQLLVILSVMNLLDRFLIDGYRVGHTNAWTIPRNRGSQTVHYRKRQAEKMAFRYGRHGGHSGCAGGNYDGFYSLRKEPMKYKIEKNTVQETLILPLYSRKLCTELYPNLYREETAVRLLDQIDYDFFRGREKFPQPDAAVRRAGGGHAAE